MIDLHLHSNLSDGSESPARVVELAAEVGCSAIALTDHDGLLGLKEGAQRAVELGIRFIPGCEVSCTSQTGSIHLLCYYIRDDHGPLQDELVRLMDDRRLRNEALIERLNEINLPITYEEVIAEAGQGAVGRPHFAAVLVRNGAADSIQDAFDRYLARGRPGYVTKTRAQPETIIELTRASGGVVSLAHPLSLELGPVELKTQLGELAEVGLTGLECYYGRYDPQTRTQLARVADELNLVATGGSDFHGSYKPDLSIGIGTGDLHVPDDVLDALDAELARVSSPS